MMSTLNFGAQRTLVTYICNNPGPTGVLEVHCSSVELVQTTPSASAPFSIAVCMYLARAIFHMSWESSFFPDNFA